LDPLLDMTDADGCLKGCDNKVVDKETGATVIKENPRAGAKNLWIKRPTEKDVIMPGAKFEIVWEVSPEREELDKACDADAFNLDEAYLEIGYMEAGRSNFTTNITECVPFSQEKYVWDVPVEMPPGGYWLAARLLHPRTKTQFNYYAHGRAWMIEAAAPPNGGFAIHDIGAAERDAEVETIALGKNWTAPPTAAPEDLPPTAELAQAQGTTGPRSLDEFGPYFIEQYIIMDALSKQEVAQNVMEHYLHEKEKLQQGLSKYSEDQGKGFICWRFINNTHNQ